MSPSVFRRQSVSSFDTKNQPSLITGLWQWIGDKLQAVHQNRRNQRTYSMLLQNDDYLLRDIGINRHDIERLARYNGSIEAGRELEKLRITQGRHHAH